MFTCTFIKKWLTLSNSLGWTGNRLNRSKPLELRSKTSSNLCLHSSGESFGGFSNLLSPMVWESESVMSHCPHIFGPLVYFDSGPCLCPQVAALTAGSPDALLCLICHGNKHFLITVSVEMVITTSLFSPLNTHISVLLALCTLPPCSSLRQPFIKYTRQSFK